MGYLAKIDLGLFPKIAATLTLMVIHLVFTHNKKGEKKKGKRKEKLEKVFGKRKLTYASKKVMGLPLGTISPSHTPSFQGLTYPLQMKEKAFTQERRKKKKRGKEEKRTKKLYKTGSKPPLKQLHPLPLTKWLGK